MAAAQAVYNLYAIAPAMAQESPGGRGWGLERFISRRDADWFGYLSDAEDFYEKGPGFADSDITYRMAEVLLDDFFEKAEAKRAGTSDLGAELRFTHAEEIIPLAALMGLPGSTRGVTASKPYTYADNAWRGSEVAPSARTSSGTCTARAAPTWSACSTTRRRRPSGQAVFRSRRAASSTT